MIQPLGGRNRDKYSQSILQIFWILFLAGFCYLTQLCSEACVISLLLPHYSQFSEAMHNGTYNNLEMISFSKFIGFLNFKVNAYTFLLISFSTDWNGKSLLRLYLLVKGRKSQKQMCCDSNSTKNKMPGSAITHSQFGHYFYSNLYGRAPQGSQGCQKIRIIFFTNKTVEFLR